MIRVKLKLHTAVCDCEMAQSSVEMEIRVKNKFILADSEEEIMELLWKTGRKMPAKEIMDYFNDNHNKNWKKQTMNTFLFRLLEAKFIERTSEDRRYLYSPIISKKVYEQNKAESFITNAYNGSFLNFINALSGGQIINNEEAEEIKKLIRGN